MKKLLNILLSLILLTFISTTAYGVEPKEINKNSENPEVQILIKQLKELRKQERELKDKVVSKRHAIKAALEGKDQKFKEGLEKYNYQITTINTSMKQIKEKKIMSWTQLKEARENNDLEKLKTELRNLIYLEKQTIDNVNKKLSVLDSMISSLNN